MGTYIGQPGQTSLRKGRGRRRQPEGRALRAEGKASTRASSGGSIGPCKGLGSVLGHGATNLVRSPSAPCSQVCLSTCVYSGLVGGLGGTRAQTKTGDQQEYCFLVGAGRTWRTSPRTESNEGDQCGGWCGLASFSFSEETTLRPNLRAGMCLVKLRTSQAVGTAKL